MAARAQNRLAKAPSRGLYFNSGNGPSLVPVSIGHKTHIAVMDPDTAFWALVKKEKLADTLSDPRFLAACRKKNGQFAREMQMLRFELKPSCVYFNPTERCNLNCAYCYIPGEMRKSGRHMTEQELLAALAALKTHFAKTMPKGRRPQIIFHGAEPMLNREAVFRGIEKHGRDFRFGIQTNATLLDDEAIAFLTARNVGIGLSLDGPSETVADKTRTTWKGGGVFKAVEKTIEKLSGYDNFSVICTITAENMRHLGRMVDYLHARQVPSCLLNIVRCTLPPSMRVKPDDAPSVRHFLAALDRSHALYKKTGRKLVVANFANIMLSILAPTARRLMCDISPCGGGRAFFALAANGDLFPCSEFVGLEKFNGGNLFKGGVEAALESDAFRQVTGRKVEDIEACRRCAIRHFCGSPCPAEAHEANGGMRATGSFCEFYEEQARYAFRAIADGVENDYLWDGWDKGTKVTFAASGF